MRVLPGLQRRSEDRAECTCIPGSGLRDGVLALLHPAKGCPVQLEISRHSLMQAKWAAGPGQRWQSLLQGVKVPERGPHRVMLSDSHALPTMKQPRLLCYSYVSSCLHKFPRLFQNMNRHYLRLYTDGDVADPELQPPPFGSVILSFQEHSRCLWLTRIFFLLLRGYSSILGPVNC